MILPTQILYLHHCFHCMVRPEQWIEILLKSQYNTNLDQLSSNISAEMLQYQLKKITIIYDCLLNKALPDPVCFGDRGKRRWSPKGGKLRSSPYVPESRRCNRRCGWTAGDRKTDKSNRTLQTMFLSLSAANIESNNSAWQTLQRYLSFYAFLQYYSIMWMVNGAYTPISHNIITPERWSEEYLLSCYNGTGQRVGYVRQQVNILSSRLLCWKQEKRANVRRWATWTK